MVSLASQKRRLATSIFQSMLYFWLCCSLILIILILISFSIKEAILDILWIGFETKRTEIHLLPYFSIFSISHLNIGHIFRTLTSIDANAVIDIAPLLVSFLKLSIFIRFMLETIFTKTFISSSWLCIFSPKTIVRTFWLLLKGFITSLALFLLELLYVKIQVRRKNLICTLVSFKMWHLNFFNFN